MPSHPVRHVSITRFEKGCKRDLPDRKTRMPWPDYYPAFSYAVDCHARRANGSRRGCVECSEDDAKYAPQLEECSDPSHPMNSGWQSEIGQGE